MFDPNKSVRAARWAVLATALTACGLYGPSPVPGDGIVEATPGLAFEPQQAKVHVNGTIAWKFGMVPHNVVFAETLGRPADIRGLNSSTSIARTFGTPGTYPYECTLHPGMKGTVVVTQDDGSSVYQMGGDTKPQAPRVVPPDA